MGAGVLWMGEGRGNPTGPWVALGTKSWLRTQQRGAEDSNGAAASKNRIPVCARPTPRPLGTP